MEINNHVNARAGVNATRAANDRNKLSIDDFLKIMAAEISNQNIMGDGGGSNTDYLSQLATFTTIEQMSEISDALGILTLMSQQQQAFSLIGKAVTFVDGDGEFTGIVDSVKFVDGYATLIVGNKEFYLGALLEVNDGSVVDMIEIEKPKESEDGEGVGDGE